MALDNTGYYSSPEINYRNSKSIQNVQKQITFKGCSPLSEATKIKTMFTVLCK